MARVASLSLLLLALAAAACSSTVADVRDGLDDDVSHPVDQQAELQRVFEEWADDGDGGGVAAVRPAGGTVISFSAGEDPQTGEKLSSGALVRVGSVSKVFTTVLVIQMVEAGDVELDAPISTYVDGLAIANDVTVRQLLAHQTGIPNYTDSRGFVEVVLKNPTREPAPADLIAFTNGESDFDPGTRFAYSNTNFIILGMLVEAVAEKPLNEVLAEGVSGPLDLANTRFDDGTIDDVAGGYSLYTPSGNSFDQSYVSLADGSWAAGGLVSTAEELAAFFDALFFGDLLTKASIAEMTSGLDDGADYGLGLHTGPDFGVGHGGAIIGFNSMAEIDPDTGELIVVVVNNDARDPEVVTARLAEVLGR